MHTTVVYQGETLTVELDTETNTDLLHYIVKNFNDSMVKLHVAKNPNTQTRTLLLLAKSEVILVSRYVAHHKNSTVKVWEKLFSHYMDEALALILATKPISPKILHRLVMENHHTAGTLIENPNTSIETLSYIINNVFVADLSKIFAHPNCSKEIIVKAVTVDGKFRLGEQLTAWWLIKSWPEHTDWPEEWVFEHYGISSSTQLNIQVVKNS